MLRLNLLGAVDLRGGDGRSLNGAVGGTKPLAVLIYLALEGARHPVRRDKVMAVLWPEADQERARQSLSQALLTLRKGIGDVVISSGQDLSIDRALITSDAFDFAELAATGRLEDAVALYRDDVATGFHARVAEFDDWLFEQRNVWHSHLAAVLMKLFSASIEANDLDTAAKWASRLLDVAPEKDHTVRTLLPLLIDQGQAAAAKRLYQKYERRLAEVFDTTPPADVAALMTSLPQPRRFDATSRSPSIHVADPLPRRRGSLAIAAAALVVLAVTSVFVWSRATDESRGEAAAYNAPPRVAVLPFASPAATQRSAKVLNEALQWRLRTVGFQVLNASADTSAVQDLVGSDGAEGMTFVVGGDVATKSDGSLAAALWLQDAGNGKRVWESRFTQPASQAHLIATQLSDAIATQIRRAAGNVIVVTPGIKKVSAESWKDLYDAREGMEAALEMRWHGAGAGATVELKDADLKLTEVTEREPDWALPWVLRGRIAEARAFSSILSGNPGEGAIELDRGIRMLDSVAPRLDSNDVYEMSGLLRSRRFMFGVDDVAAANRLLTRAEEDLRKASGPARDPSGSYTALSTVMFMQGRYAEAFVYARRAYDSNVFLRNNEEMLTRLFNSAFHAGDDASADFWCKEIQKTLPRQWPAVLCRIHIAGFAPGMVAPETLEREIENMAAPAPVRQAMTPRLKAAYAITLAQTGRADSARATLARVSSSNDPDVVLFRAFAFAALRDAPRAHAELRTYLAENRGTRSTALRMRWLESGIADPNPVDEIARAGR